jgi:Tfp pilus assembly protein PilX
VVDKSLEKNFHLPDNRGSVLIAGLLVLLVLSILGLAAMMTTSMELKISANDRAAKRAFYLAEAGLEDTRSRMQTGASSFPIYDTHPTNHNMEIFIATNEKSVTKGYQSTNSNHARYTRLNTSLDYLVTITHKLDSSGNILYGGDSDGDGVPEENISLGKNIYVSTSEGYTPDGASKPILIEVTLPPDITVPAALYTGANTVVQGNSTYILGLDHCCSTCDGTIDLPGIISMSTVTENGLPQIERSPPVTENSTQNINIQYMINRFKQKANYPYNISSTTLTGMNWGGASSWSHSAGSLKLR